MCPPGKNKKKMKKTIKKPGMVPAWPAELASN
jgi:hypothetical protein